MSSKPYAIGGGVGQASVIEIQRNLLKTPKKN